MSADLNPVAARVRAADPDRFYAALLAPAAKREALFALLAFNHEVARVREAVSDPIIGEMRLAWWREVLDEIDSGAKVRAHPVAEALRAAHASHGFELDPLRRLVDARSFDLYDEPMADRSALEAYATATGGALHLAMAQALGGREGEIEAAQSAGTAFALTGLLRALRIHASRGQLYLPLGELKDLRIAPASIFGGEASEGLCAALRSVVDLARRHMERAREPVRRAVFPAKAACAILPPYWRRFESARLDPFRDEVELGSFERIIRILVAGARGSL